MSQNRRSSLYVSLLSSMVAFAREQKENDAKEGFSDIANRLKEDFCPPFDRSALLLLASDLYALAVFRKTALSSKDDTLFFELFENAVKSLPDVSSPKYDPSIAEELVSLCAKKSRTSQGYQYLNCVRSLLFLIGNTL